MRRTPTQWNWMGVLPLWWRGEDLNLRPPGYEPGELPNCSTPRRVHHITRGVMSRPNRVQVTSATCPLVVRSEEHTSELQSRFDLVCRLLLEKKTQENTSDLTSRIDI